MATSGRVNTDTYKTSSFYVKWERTDYSIPSNYSEIKWKAGLNITGSDEWYSNAVKITGIVINGTTVYSGGTFSNISGSGDHQLATGTIRINHKTDGTKTFNISIKGWLYSGHNLSGNKDFTLDTIPRYFTKDPILEKHSKTETTYTWTWTTSETCSKVVVYVNGTSKATWTGSAKTGTIKATGLSPNTEYDVHLVCTRKDSGLTSKSKIKQYTTYDYPHCTSTPNFVVGKSFTINLYNPLGRTVTVTMIGANGSTRSAGEYNSTSVTGFSNTNWSNFWYASIPQNERGTYQVQVTYEGHNKVSKVGTYSIDTSLCTPTFSNFTYKDTNTTINNLIGTNQAFVKGFSTLQVTISSANKMVAKNGASPIYYKAVMDTLNKSANYNTSDVTINLGTVTNSGTKRLSVAGFDSRKLFSSVNKDITIYDYSKPTININGKRLNDFETQTTLKISGTYSRLTVNNSDKNTITSIQYRYRETGGTWSSWTNTSATITSGKFTCSDIILSLDNTKSFQIEVKATDKLSNNTVSGNVDIGEAIFFISTNKKQCYINGKQVMTGLAQDVNRTDLNDYKNEFVAGYGHNLTNSPVDNLNLGHIISIPRHDVENYTTQLFFPYTTKDMYIRKCEAGVWGAWSKFNDDKSTNFLRLTMSADYTASSTAEQKLTLNTTNLKNGNLLQPSNGGILVGAGVKYIEVHAQIYFFTGTSANKSIKIYKNGADCDTRKIVSYSNYHMYDITNYIAVKEGDLITFVSELTSGDKIGKANTHLIAKVLG